MMRMLAEFIMRGRMQAIYVALIGSWLPLLPQATLGLVTLRKGWREGIYITLAALAPVLAGMYWGNIGPTMVVTSGSIFLLAYMQSLVLRWSVSWSATLFFVVASSGVCGVIVTLLNGGLQEEIAAFYQEMLEGSEQDNPALVAQMESVLADFTTLKGSGFIAFSVAMTGLAGLFIARWLQAMLYNPGGFRTEFHGLRLNMQSAAVGLGAWLYCVTQSNEYLFWGYLISLPLVVAGLALAHWLNNRINGGYGVLIAMYIAFFILGDLALMLVMFLGFTDSLIHYREKFKFKQ